VSDNKNKGFGGLGDLVSDISEDIAPQSLQKPEPPRAQSKPAEPQPPQRDQEQQAKQKAEEPAESICLRVSPVNQKSNESDTPPGGTSGNGVIAWVIGIVAAISLLIVFSSNNDKPSTNSSSSYSAPAPSVQVPVPAQTQPTQPSFDVQKPSVGENQVLNTKGIRYCTLEKIRLDAIESVVKSSNSPELRQFNGRIADYNSRCGSFRYRRGELQQVQSEINLNRAYIENTAKSEWVRHSIGIDTPAKPKLPEKSPAKSPAVGASAKSAPQSCTVDQECPGTLFCMSGKCAPPAWQTQETQTTTRTKNMCTLDSECPGNLFCISGACAAQFSLGASCNRDVECGDIGSRCTSSRCVMPGSNSQAPTPALSASTNQSQPNNMCSDDNQCPGSLFCISGSCAAQRGLGAACSRDIECGDVGSRCTSNRCVMPGARTQLTPPTVAAQDRAPSLNSISSAERSSLESVCNGPKVLEGPAAYNRCISNKLAEMKSAPKRPDFSDLTSVEKDSIESVCNGPRVLEGPAAYNRCLSGKLAALRNGPKRPDLSGLSNSEKESIESVCNGPRVLEGPSAYNRCLSEKLAAMRNAPKRPDLAGLSNTEKDSLESVCNGPRVLEGPAAYNRCLSGKLAALKNAPRPDLSSLKYSERETIESACNGPRLLEGPAAYNICLASKLRKLRG